MTEEELVLEHWRLWSMDRSITSYEIWKKRYLKGLK
jgi:hypothetical protein